jgi:hypothetical protein
MPGETRLDDGVIAHILKSLSACSELSQNIISDMLGTRCPVHVSLCVYACACACSSAVLGTRCPFRV